jgi:phage-related minor tail protein
LSELAFVREITPGTVGIFSLLAVVSVALIRAWPILALQAQQARDRLRNEQRDDLSDCRKEIAQLRKELAEVSAAQHSFEMKLLGTIAAYRILDTEVQLLKPDSSALAQARAVMSTTFSVSPSTEGAFEIPEGRQ